MCQRLRPWAMVGLVLFAVAGDVQPDETDDRSHDQSHAAESVSEAELVAILRAGTSLHDVTSAIALLGDSLSGESPGDLGGVLAEAASALGRFTGQGRGLAEAWFDLAILYELTGRYEEAQEGYERSYFLDPPGGNYAALVRSAVLLLYLGEYRRAENQARLATNLTADDSVRAQGAVVVAYAMAAGADAARSESDGRDPYAVAAEEAASFLESVPQSAAVIYARMDLLERAGSTDSADELAGRLRAVFPGSAEALLSEKRGVTQLPGPMLLIGALSAPYVSSVPARQPEAEPAALGVQTGSFRVPGNAADMVRSLETKGFAAFVREVDRSGVLYHQVIVDAFHGPDGKTIVGPAGVADLMTALEDAGYEGVRAYATDQ